MRSRGEEIEEALRCEEAYSHARSSNDWMPVLSAAGWDGKSNPRPFLNRLRRAALALPEDEGVDPPRPAPSAESVREAAAKVVEKLIGEHIDYLKKSSDEEKQEYGYIRAKQEKWIDGRPCRGFRDGWTLYGFARNESCVLYRTLPAAIRSLPLPPASKVERAREEVVEKAKCCVRQYPNTPSGLKSAVDALLAAEDEANKGGSDE